MLDTPIGPPNSNASFSAGCFIFPIPAVDVLLVSRIVSWLYPLRLPCTSADTLALIGSEAIAAVAIAAVAALVLIAYPLLALPSLPFPTRVWREVELTSAAAAAAAAAGVVFSSRA